MQRFVISYMLSVNIFSTSYSEFLDSFRIFYTQVTECFYDTFWTSIYFHGFNYKKHKLLYLKVYFNMINF